MSGRDFNIPMGPDRTGGVSIPEVVPTDGAPDGRTIAQPPLSAPDFRGFDTEAGVGDEQDSAAADDASSHALGTTQSFNRVGAESGAEAGGRSDRMSSDDDYAAEESEASAGEGAMNNVAASLGALRDSIGQGRELKAREKEREELAYRIDDDREELADRDDILANYAAIVGEQDQIIAENTQQRERCKAELAQAAAEIEETTEALNRMRDYHDGQLQPLETALGRAQAAADQAKNDERSRKSELNAAESEVRRAENGDDSHAARARLDVVTAAHDEAVARSNSAKEAYEEARRAYDDLREQVEQAEAPLENAIADLEHTTEDLKEEIARLGDIISAATKRRQYCDSVYQYPAETEKLRQNVQADEAELDRMDEDNDELREQLAQSKKKSVMAKGLIVGIIVFVILLILLFWYLSAR